MMGVETISTCYDIEIATFSKIAGPTLCVYAIDIISKNAYDFILDPF
jgi:hypothetical protein